MLGFAAVDRRSDAVAIWLVSRTNTADTTNTPATSQPPIDFAIPFAECRTSCTAEHSLVTGRSLPVDNIELATQPLSYPFILYQRVLLP